MTTARPILPPPAAVWLAELERPAVLGASRQIEIATALMASLSEACCAMLSERTAQAATIK